MDELIVRARQNCCRLCLAPDSECVPIFTSFAADKEPLSTKIQACVNIKVNQADRLSSRICHACISYLNSWQSFKNRCIASQLKQRNWVEMAQKTVRKQLDSIRLNNVSINNTTSEPNATQQTTPQNPMPLPLQIKVEPKDEDDDGQDEGMKVDIDPIEFLARRDEDDEENGMQVDSKPVPARPVLPSSEGPQILTSLGLTHIKSVNPFSFLSTELDQENGLQSTLNDTDNTENISVNHQTPTKTANAMPACRVCKLSFSTRANARRHERNIHGKILNNTVPKQVGKQGVKSQKRQQLAPEMLGIYDYKKPEKYRHLLTEQKLAFIRKNEDFLKQYQNLTCNCCPKSFPTYKNFMAHMRKKYQNIGRNLCFKCLKQFQTKPMFVSHLKKRNCINLYKLYLSDESIPKTEMDDNVPIDKMGAKDLLTNKVYECKICSKTSRLKTEFRTHVYEEHSEFQKKDVPPGYCSFCGLEIEDPVERKRHYNNMECIVSLRCVTCESKFDTHQKFIEHVYESHLPQHLANNNDEPFDFESSFSKEDESPKNDGNIYDPRMPQSCKICGLHYNNYNNVLRHMEAKHPDQLPPTYKCTKCDLGYPRLSMLRHHMLETHGSKLPKHKRDSGITCRMCSESFIDREKWITHQSEHHSRYTCCQCNYQNKNIDEFKKHIATHPNLSSSPSLKRIENSDQRSNTPDRYDYVMRDLLLIKNGIEQKEKEEAMTNDNEKSEISQSPPSKKMKLEPNLKECNICHMTFSGNLGLSNHMRAHAAVNAKRNSLDDAKIITTSINVKREVKRNVKKENDLDTKFRRVRCRICQRRFSNKKSYRRHMLIDHHVRNIQFIKCTICNSEFTHEKGLKSHMMKVHGTAMTNANSEMQFECSECSITFTSEQQFNIHKVTVHSNQKEFEYTNLDKSEQTLWFQCRYCPLHFNTNKKLSIHINSHEEFDSNDYSCKDCGNVYSGRKSLWVHRYKKHPLISDPSPCDICKKIFFDKKMLELHLQNHAKVNELQNDDDNDAAEQHEESQNQFADDEDDDHSEQQLSRGNSALPQVSCTVCSAKFSDQDLFTKHMQIHERELYTDNPLAAMFDTGPEDPNQFFMSRMGDNGEYQCDICPKSFPMLTALKVHRNWHFRSDSKQVVADPNLVWRGNVKKRKNPASVKCQYCSSTFISAKNLKRHVTELHKRETASAGETQLVFIEKHFECQKCNMKFRTNYDWVEHKINHAKAAKADETFEWGCEICGKLVSRKERLVQHLTAHLKDDDHRNCHFDGNETGCESNSQDSGVLNTSRRLSESNSEKSIDKKEDRRGQEMVYQNGNCHISGEDGVEVIQQEIDDDDDEDDDDDDDQSHSDTDSEDNDDDENEGHKSANTSDDDDDDDDDDEEAEHSDHSQASEESLPGSYSCDLCQVYFETAKQLRHHVTSHFISGPGSVTLTELPKEKILTDSDITTVTPI